MDIQEAKKFVKNKIEADALTKQVRRRIKETTWEKQIQREGFSETFKPLISQFEKSEDSQTSNIFTQNQEMLRNQIKVAEEAEKRRKATAETAKQLERLADMGEVSGKEFGEFPFIDYGDDEGWEKDWAPVRPKEEEQSFSLEKNFNGNEIEILKFYGYTRPDNFSETNIKDLDQQFQNLNENIKELKGRIRGGWQRPLILPLFGFP